MIDFFWNRKISIWTSILYIAAGLLLVLFPGITAKLFLWFLAGGSILYSVTRFWKYIRSKAQEYPYIRHLISGILFLAFGILCVAFPEFVLSFLPLTLGALLLIDGIGKLPAALEARKLLPTAFLPLAISAVIPLLLGLILIMNPFDVTKFVIMFFGICLVIDGAGELAAGYYASSKKNSGGF